MTFCYLDRQPSLDHDLRRLVTPDRDQARTDHDHDRPCDPDRAPVVRNAHGGKTNGLITTTTESSPLTVDIARHRRARPNSGGRPRSK